MKFSAVVANRLRILFSDRLFILAMILIPLLLSLIMGYAQRKEKLGYMPIAVADEDGSALSQLLAERFSGKEGIKAVLCDRQEALNLIRDEKAEAAVVILEGFERKLLAGELQEAILVVKSPSSITDELVKELVAAEVIRLQGAEFAYDWLNKSLGGGNLPERAEVWAQVESYWTPEPLMTILYEEIQAERQSGPARVTIPPFAAASLGILVLFVMLALLFGSGWICEERANGTLQRIYSSPGAMLPVFLGNASALMILGLAQVAFFVLIQKVLFDVTMLAGPGAWLVLVAYLVCAVSLSMLMASSFKTAARLQAVAPVFSILTGFLGGCLWNIAGMPGELVSLSRFTPQGWTLSAITALYANPGDLSSAWPAAGVLLGASLIMLLLGYRGLVSRKVLSET